MAKTTHIVSNYPFSLVCIALIWVLSLTPFFPETPLDDVAFIDKWTHLVMYGGTTTVIWWEYLRTRRKGLSHVTLPQMVCGTAASLTALGGLMELLQAYCTTTRSGEWLDFWADTLGVMLGTLLGLLLYHCLKGLRRN